MPTNLNDKIRKLGPARREKVEARAAQLIAEEKELINAYERGEFKPVKNQKVAKRTAVQAAKRYTRKDARVNPDRTISNHQDTKITKADQGSAEPNGPNRQPHR